MIGLDHGRSPWALGIPPDLNEKLAKLLRVPHLYGIYPLIIQPDRKLILNSELNFARVIAHLKRATQHQLSSVSTKSFVLAQKSSLYIYIYKKKLFIYCQPLGPINCCYGRKTCPFVRCHYQQIADFSGDSVRDVSANGGSSSAASTCVSSLTEGEKAGEVLGPAEASLFLWHRLLQSETQTAAQAVASAFAQLLLPGASLDEDELSRLLNDGGLRRLMMSLARSQSRPRPRPRCPSIFLMRVAVRRLVELSTGDGD